MPHVLLNHIGPCFRVETNGNGLVFVFNDRYVMPEVPQHLIDKNAREDAPPITIDKGIVLGAVFFVDPEDVPRVEEYCRTHGFTRLGT
jgi:hypothetical protein